MLNEFTLSVLTAAKDLKTKDGSKFKMNELNRSLIEQFIAFDVEASWMEAKDHTKLGRALASAVVTGSELIGQPLMRDDGRGLALYDNIIFLTVDRLFMKGYHADHGHETVKARINALSPIVDKFNAMNKRLTKNGKFPKEEAERRKREAIKGTIDPKLNKVLSEVSGEWYTIIFKYEVDWALNMIQKSSKYLGEANDLLAEPKPKDKEEIKARREKLEFLESLVKWGLADKMEGETKYRWVTKSQVDARAKFIATQESESFYYKMTDKLSGLVTGERAFLDASHSTGGRTPFISTLTFEFENNTKIVMENKIIANTSVLGNSYYQYPCTFNVVIIDGERMSIPSEAAVKRAFLR